MESEAVLEQMRVHLLSNGLNNKKLSIFLPNDADSIAYQVCRDLGTVCEQRHVDAVAELIKVARDEEPLQKRLRGDLSLDPLQPQMLEEKRTSLQSFPSSSVAPDLFSTEDDIKPCRRSARFSGMEDERQKRETIQKENWSRELFKELTRMEAPALRHLEHCVDQKHLHLALAGRTRPNTLKRYVKTWKAFRQWMEAARGEAVSHEVGDLVEYLFTRFDEPCGPTVPGLIVKAIAWMERTECLDVRERIADSQVVCSVRDYIVEMLSKDRPPTQRAPRYPVVMMESLEHVVEDESLRVGFRIIAWVKLVKLWATLRWDDVQKIVPKELKFFGGRMTTILRSTKTTGPTRRVQELPVCVSEHAYISSPFWLKTGFDLIRKHAPFERDYLLPKLNEEWSAFRKAMASYSDVSAYSARLRRKLKRPGESEPVIHHILAIFWTEHSERATLPTGLSLLGAAKDERDMLGRWKPDGSDTYLRMYNGVIARLQLQFAKVARQDDRTVQLDERDIIESAMSWLSDRFDGLPSETSDRISQHLEQSMGAPILANWTPVGEEPLLGPPPLVQKQIVAEEDEKREERELARKEKRVPLYVVVNNGKKCKRLHKSQGGCWMGREMNFKSSTEFFTMPDSVEFTHYCKVCWPKGGQFEDAQDSSSSSSTSSSRSASSSSNHSSE